MLIVCPCGCDHKFTVSVKSVSGVTINPDSPLTGSVLRAVLEFMRHRGPGRATVAELYEEFKRADAPWATGGRGLSYGAFARALRRNGAIPWRNAVQRGYDIPAVPDDQLPAAAAPTVQAAEDQRALEELIVSHATPVLERIERSQRPDDYIPFSGPARRPV